MNTFFSYWYQKSPHRFYQGCRTVIESFDQTIAVSTTLQNLGRPLFQDYTWQGRVIGFFFRLTRIVAGYVLYAMIAVIFLLAYLTWVAAPLIFVTSLIGSLIAQP